MNHSLGCHLHGPGLQGPRRPSWAQTGWPTPGPGRGLSKRPLKMTMQPFSPTRTPTLRASQKPLYRCQQSWGGGGWGPLGKWGVPRPEDKANPGAVEADGMCRNSWRTFLTQTRPPLWSVLCSLAIGLHSLLSCQNQGHTLLLSPLRSLCPGLSDPHWGLLATLVFFGCGNITSSLPPPSHSLLPACVCAHVPFPEGPLSCGLRAHPDDSILSRTLQRSISK